MTNRLDLFKRIRDFDSFLGNFFVKCGVSVFVKFSYYPTAAEDSWYISLYHRITRDIHEKLTNNSTIKEANFPKRGKKSMCESNVFRPKKFDNSAIKWLKTRKM